MTADFTISELFQAYYDCRKTKRNTWNALNFEERLERNLMDLYYELQDGQYAPGRSICFVVQHPKIREIWAADFRDRIVHHLLYNRIAERFHNRFIYDTYACIPGRGTHRAVDRAERFARSLTQNYTRPGYVLKADIANFFVSIDKARLDTLLAREIAEPWWMGLCRTILHHNPADNVYVKSPTWLLRQVPRHKSLFHAPAGHGLPIGNLSSQFFGNVYLNDFDHYVKGRLGQPRYIRYVDDLLVLGDSGSELHELVSPINRYMGEHLGLRLHPNKTSINRVAHGFDMLGFVVRPHARYLARRTVRSAHMKLGGMCRARANPKRIQATANSYLGICRQANAYRQRHRLAQVLRDHGHLVSPTLNRMFCGDPL